MLKLQNEDNNMTMNTPVTLIDKEILKNNIQSMQKLCDSKHKLLMPMMKTHKSSEIAKMQIEAGCYGFLCGTIDECFAAYDIKAENIMYAYPVSTLENLTKLCALAKVCNMTIRTDSIICIENAQQIAKESGVTLGMSVIVDCGFHRFGVQPEQAAKLAAFISKEKNLSFDGFSTHPGHVYQKVADQVELVANEECLYLEQAVEKLSKYNLKARHVTSGSTPTINRAIDCQFIDVFHPGNYVFNDYIQMTLNIVKEEQCALTVMASIISHPREGIYIMDAGAKCLGLDKGAHGNVAITGYGYIKGHSDAQIISLSEEVGVIASKENEFQIGQIVHIIPNHSCSTANLTSRLYNLEDSTFMHVDIRNGCYNYTNNLLSSRGEIFTG